MALVSSTMADLGSAMPSLVLPDLRTGQNCEVLQGDCAQPVLVMFICAHCPYVVHVEQELASISRDFADSEIAIYAISSNDAENYPDDAPNKLRAQAERLGLACPYLYDEDQLVARAFAAACTPDFFLYDREHRLYYRGQLDASRPGKNVPCDGSDLRGAMTRLLQGMSPPENQQPSIGCNLKWKKATS